MSAPLASLGVPALMATQHPDSASRYVGSREEVEEAVMDLLPLEDGGYGCDEKMIDYEGKLTPYHQVEWVVEALVRAGLSPGRDFLLTPRIPSERLEGCVRQVMVLWGVMAANKLSLTLAGGQAVRFIVHPMSESSWELVATQKRVLKVQRLAEEELGLRGAEPPRLVPLIEDVVRLFNADRMVSALYSQLAGEGIVDEGLRVFLGKSDAALAYGHLASSIGLVVALSRLDRWSESEGVRVYPIIGVGKPPFRGNLSPEAVEVFVHQYSGYYTVTMQSAVRFDTPRGSYEKLVSVLRSNVAREVRRLEPGEEKLLVEAARLAAREYLRLLLQLADRVTVFARFIPRRRERLPEHQYHRDLGTAMAFAGDASIVSLPPPPPLPRAIKFTAALYTMGLPPTVLGLGRGLQAVEKKLGGHALELVLKSLPLLSLDLRVDSRWFSWRTVERCLPSRVLELVREDVRLLWEILGFEPQPPEDYERKLLQAVDAVAKGDSSLVQRLVEELAVARGFLG